MEWKLCQRNNQFDTQILKYLKMGLIYAHLRNHTSTV